MVIRPADLKTRWGRCMALAFVLAFPVPILAALYVLAETAQAAVQSSKEVWGVIADGVSKTWRK